MVAYSSVYNFQVYLPGGNSQTSLLNLVVFIRDFVDGITEFNIFSISVTVDTAEINDLMNVVQNSSSQGSNNQFVQLLSSGNQNVVGQIGTSLSQVFNNMNSKNVDNAVSSK